VLAVAKLDRLARSVRHLTVIAAELDALGVGLVVLDQAIDTTTPSGKLLFHVLRSIAEFDRDLIRERTQAGLESAKRRGVKLGRRHSLDDVSRERLARLVASGIPQRRIAELLECSKGTVGRDVARLRGRQQRRVA